MAVNSSPLIKLLNEQLSSQEIIILVIQNRTQVAPVAFSLMASFMSAITLLGVTQENYTYGTQVSSRHELCLNILILFLFMHPMSWLQFVAINLAYLLATPVATHIFLPVFYRLRAVSVYQWVMMVKVMMVMIIIIHPLYIQLFPFQLFGVEVWSSRSPSCFHGFLTSDGSLYGWVVPTEYQWPPSIQIVKDNMRKHPHYHYPS